MSISWYCIRPCLCQLEYYDTYHGHDTVLYSATASSHFAIQFPVMPILQYRATTDAMILKYRVMFSPEL